MTNYIPFASERVRKADHSGTTFAATSVTHSHLLSAVLTQVMEVLRQCGLENSVDKMLISSHATPEGAIEYLSFVASLEEWSWRGW